MEPPSSGAKVSPTGSTVARTRPNNVRGAASAATDGVRQNGSQPESGATTTARPASSGAKGTVASARKPVADAATTARRATTTTGRTTKLAAENNGHNSEAGRIEDRELGDGFPVTISPSISQPGIALSIPADLLLGMLGRKMR